MDQNGHHQVIVTDDYADDPPEFELRPSTRPNPIPNPASDDKISVEKPRDAYAQILKRFLREGLKAKVSITIGTMCSGTDSPILALRELQEASLAVGTDNLFDFDHTFSVEIEPFKQAFIERNAQPSGQIFRDVVDVSLRDKTDALTAHGYIAPIPDGPDILVAGSSCVDFSAQNTARKTILQKSKLKDDYETHIVKHKGAISPKGKSDEDEVLCILDGLRDEFSTAGESEKTFVSILTYAYTHRPKIVIIENVSGAPWDQFTKWWLPLIGYEAGYVRLDSKDFLVPQTRQRGYLMAVDQWLYGSSSKHMVEKWKVLMTKLAFKKQQPDLHSFLLNPQDPAVLAQRFAKERHLANTPIREVEARMCAWEHLKARRDESLGSGHPFSRKDVVGNMRFVEFSWQEELQMAGHRAQDLMDIMCLRTALLGFDLMHKTMIVDVSQNVMRTILSSNSAKCILPDGELLITNQGRFILGAEALALQGLPLDRICTSVETQSQLHDLAGNAMTATVVGSVLLAAISSEQTFARKLKPIDETIPLSQRLFALRPSERTRTDTLQAGQYFNTGFTTTDFDPNIVRTLLEVYKHVRRYCLCGGCRKHNPSTGLQQCSVCREIRCQSCAGNPPHRFIPYIVERVIPADAAMDLLEDIMPGRFRLADAQQASTIQDRVKPSNMAQEMLQHAREKIAAGDRRALEAVSTKLITCLDKVYYLNGVSQGDDITFTYVSRDSHIRIIVSEDKITWLLFAEKVEIESLPVARAIIEHHRESILPELRDWQVFFPQSKSLTLSITFNSVGLTCKVMSSPYPSLCTFQNLEGPYQFSSDCATPLAALYAPLSPKSGGPYHFIDSDPKTSSGADDRWVFAAAPIDRAPGIYREVYCRFPKGWLTKDRKPDTGECHTECSVDGFWLAMIPHNQALEPSGMLRVKKFPPQPTATEVVFEELSVSVDPGFIFPDVTLQPFDLLQLKVPITDLPINVPLLLKLWDIDGTIFKECGVEDGYGGKWFRVNAQHQMDALSFASFALSAAAKAIGIWAVQSNDTSIFQILDDQLMIPEVFQLSEPVTRRTSTVFNEPSAARVFAESYKKRPLPIEVDAQIIQAGDSLQEGSRVVSSPVPYKTLVLRLCINPTTLAHSSWLHLPKEGTDRGIRRDIVHQTTVSFHMTPHDVEPTLKLLKPFSTMFTSTEDSELRHSVQPPSFINYKLRVGQQGSVQWMMAKEATKESFIEQEIEEYRIPGTSIRFRASAQTINQSRGGVLAHDVGYGKTVVTLALVDLQREKRPQGTIAERREWTEDRHLHLHATLIICPPQIVEQWLGEAQKFLGSSWYVRIVKSEQDILELHDDKADIIILDCTLLSKPAYLQMVNDLSAAPKQETPVDKMSDRAFHNQQRKNMDMLGSLREFCVNNPTQSMPDEIRERRQNTEKTTKLASQHMVPDSHRKPTTNVKKAGSQRSGNATLVRKKAGTALDVRKTRKDFTEGAVLELFTFERVVLDEFSYENRHISSFFSNIVAGSKWILSGTPPLANLSHVCNIGNLINIHVARAEPSVPQHFPTITQGPVVDEYTQSENLRLYGEPKSARFAVERHEQAEYFLRSKLRRRETNTEDIRVSEKVMVTYMDPVTTIIYAELQQLLCDAKWDINQVSQGMRPIVRGLMGEGGGAGGRKIGQSLMKAFTASVEVMLLLASSNLMEYSRLFQKHRNLSNPPPNPRALFDEILQVYRDEQQTLEKRLKSLLDRFVYVSAMAQANEGQSKGGAESKRRMKDYLAHFSDYINDLHSEAPQRMGGKDIRDLLRLALASA